MSLPGVQIDMSLPQTANATRKQGPPWAFRIATILGIPVRIHVTFLLFLGWLGLEAGVRGASLVLALFVCVILHEFGHALTARRYGIGTRDITLYPIGGVAMLSGRLRPRHELWVALAGPAVNVVIALVLGIALAATGGLTADRVQDTFVGNLMAANVAMAVFNLIPAFPMDGGRVLRALIARGTSEARATQIAAAVGQTLAIAMFVFGLLRQEPSFSLIAVFIFFGAGQENRSETTRSFLSGHRVREAMQTRFLTIPHGASLESAAQMLLEGSQHDFPVVTDDEVLGIVTRNDIAQGIANGGPGAYVAGAMRRDFKSTTPEAPLEEIAEMFSKIDPTPILVFEGAQLVGMVTTENVGEFLMLEQARKNGV